MNHHVRAGGVEGARHFRADAPRAAVGSTEWFKAPEDVVPMALFLATQPAQGPTGQTFSLARREL